MAPESMVKLTGPGGSVGGGGLAASLEEIRFGLRRFGTDRGDDGPRWGVLETSLLSSGMAGGIRLGGMKSSANSLE